MSTTNSKAIPTWADLKCFVTNVTDSSIKKRIINLLSVPVIVNLDNEPSIFSDKLKYNSVLIEGSQYFAEMTEDLMDCFVYSLTNETSVPNISGGFNLNEKGNNIFLRRNNYLSSLMISNYNNDYNIAVVDTEFMVYDFINDNHVSSKSGTFVFYYNENKGEFRITNYVGVNAKYY